MQNPNFKPTLLLAVLSLLPFNLLQAQFTPPPCNNPTNFQELDINNVRARFWASGSMWLDPVSTHSNYEVPKGSDLHSFFSFDLWMGAIDQFEQKRLDWQMYPGNFAPNTYFPGPLDEDGETSLEICEPFDRVWKINKSAIDSFHQGLFTTIPKDILEWPAKGNPHISFAPKSDLAPFIDTNNDQIYNPSDGDYPEILGDQALWWVFNDNGSHQFIGFLPLQFEVQVMAYAYNSDPALQNHTFYKYTFTNKSGGRLDDAMLGLFTDMDLGQFDDDYVGCDTLRNMGIAYNGDAQDGDYGLDIPMAAIKLLQGPQKSDGTYSNMYTFWSRSSDFSIHGIPNDKQSACFGLWGLFKNGEGMTYGGPSYGVTNTPTRYMYSSDPTDVNGWTECSENNPPADRSLFMGVGPFSIEQNQQKELHFAALWVRNNIDYPCPSFAPIQEAADYVQSLFDNNILTNIEEKPTSTNSKSNIRLFPNPAAANTVLQLEQNPNQAFQTGEWKLFDATGKLVESVTLKASRLNEWKFSNLPSGIYFYQLQWENGSMENGKWVVQ